jgi:coenzyme F420-reducing hydrogenase alpha subunit
MLGLSPATNNPYLSQGARLVEVLHCVEQSMHLIDHLLLDGLAYQAPVVTCKAREGVAMLEAPRGVLLHAYTYDREGFLTTADCVIPTAQNLANLEADLRARVPQIIDADPEQFQSELEKLVRAYDPCLSCSTHLLTIDRI